MDPKQTIVNLLDAIARNDREAIADALESLKAWNLAGGFWPTIPRGMVDTVAFVIPASRLEWVD